jgi:hypothetical protein
LSAPEPEPEPDHDHVGSGEGLEEARTVVFERASKEDDLEPWAKVLARKSSMSTTEFAAKAEVGQTKARAILARLVEAGLAGVHADGRTKMYWACRTGARPDLGLGRKVIVAQAAVDETQAAQIAATLLRTKVLGLLGEDEHLDGVELVHRLVYKLDFEEKIQRSLLRRMFGDTHDHLIGSVYVHPHDLRILVFSTDKGLRFEERPAEHASAVQDLDGAADLAEVAPAQLDIDADEWRARKPTREVKARFKQLFAATPGKITPVFVPLWRLVFRQGAGTNFRVQLVDALVGKPVDWAS